MPLPLALVLEKPGRSAVSTKSSSSIPTNEFKRIAQVVEFEEFVVVLKSSPNPQNCITHQWVSLRKKSGHQEERQEGIQGSGAAVAQNDASRNLVSVSTTMPPPLPRHPRFSTSSHSSALDGYEFLFIFLSLAPSQ
ncbi:hypothetical protein FNV43_RR01976 [Rhamnella rubrinervis]|uniref:Uncharacterized protein n=1 Tax=Rhamnella rubrinervis TaxID=2594499 RepID=A0A8K0HT94_9ROSA|nr:hypothetical protein FNV43_RR01976 [Rhamnella rubrinervis]